VRPARSPPAQPTCTDSLSRCARRTINSTALVHRTTRSAIDLSLLLDLNIYAAPSAPFRPETLAPFSQPDTADACDGCASGKPHEHAPPPTSSSPHANDISSLTIPLPPSLPSVTGPTSALYAVLSSLLWEGVLPGSSSSSSAPDEFDLLRTKGFVRTDDGREWVLQGVRDIFDFAQVPAEATAAARAGEGESMGEGAGAGEGDKAVQPKVVLIGRGLADKEGVRARFVRALEEGVERERAALGEEDEEESSSGEEDEDEDAEMGE